ncbi:MAG: ABC transporter ATP-binding protein [Gammaproteobacteria bacterium]|nr:ABC transporter ATP-binding protein [Gammaproteobacteria bacterium]
MPVLSIQSLNVSYDTKHVIQSLDLSIEPGEIVALFGPSGCGKTTVLKSIAGLIEQATGTIEVAGRRVLGKQENVATELRKVGLIFQDYALFPHLTVRENIAFGMTHLSKSEQASKVEQMLSLIKLSEYIDSYPSQLSGGQQQRIAIVRALACEPDILLFDEAFSNLDPLFRFELIADIRHLLKEHHISALFVTHNQDEAFAFCDRIAVMHQGKIEQIDTAEKLFESPKTPFIAEFLGEGVWLDCKVESATQLQSSFGTLNYSGNISLNDKVGQQARVYLRPHQLSLAENADSSVQVIAERFVGECYESTISWQAQTVIVKCEKSMLNKTVNLKVKTDIQSVFFS